ncbi:hypothetical protein NBO_15g0015 [Nosema bombycis CQ1]|uniref:Uncharacterized protein n=1 Tax=Nosema bombycis (strain CQ1 / CVCC 102059) TaxID=578461 RepID=R0MPL2_NOSB1|nr:hypothetical protein NBO_15g0015 [Nosema bombycis CQ1]|eukprot:EOB14803.1 hypothetical protein NBO_15g0015 [Nosema bombycis CQ1]
MSEETQSTFSITNNQGQTWIFYELHYCFKSKTSCVSVFYSQIENHWSFVLHSGWIKVDGRVIEFVARIKEDAELIFDDVPYIFESHMPVMIGTSQDIAITIICSDSKAKSSEQVLYLLGRKFSFYESMFVYNLLQLNNLFIIKNDIWTVNLSIYEEKSYDQTSDGLWREYYMCLETGVKFRVFEISQKGKSTPIDVVDGNLDVIKLRDGCFEIKDIHECFNWIRCFCIYPSTKNNWKRKINYNIHVKRRCFKKSEMGLNSPIIIKTLTEGRSSNIERSTTPEFVDEFFFVQRRKQTRSHSVIAKHDEEPFNVWTMNSVYKHD